MTRGLCEQEKYVQKGITKGPFVGEWETLTGVFNKGVTLKRIQDVCLSSGVTGPVDGREHGWRYYLCKWIKLMKKSRQRKSSKELRTGLL